MHLFSTSLSLRPLCQVYLCVKGGDVFFDDTLDILLGLGGDGALGDFGEEGLLGAREMLTELTLPADDLFNRNRVELHAVCQIQSVGSNVDLRTRPLTPA